MTTQPGRGGWRGGGRPRADPGDKLEVVSLRLTAVQQVKLEALGGDPWLRGQVDKASLDSAVLPDTTRAGGDDRRLPKAVRMNAVQRDKLAHLGGATWVRWRIDSARVPKTK